MGAWALSIGASIGWGSLVVTSTSFLGQGGLAGSLIGLGIGVIAMLVIARNYSYMMQLHPDSGGIYTYVKTTFGYDRAFLSSWFLVITYLAMLWANATSLPLFADRFFGDVFRFGYLYTIFGYDVYIGEVLLTIAVLFVAGFLCARGKSMAARSMVLLCFVFVVAITVCFGAAVMGHPFTSFSYDPLFVPDRGIISQVFLVAYMTPWAFVGFESVSHSVEGFNFDKKKAFRILAGAVVVAGLLYAFLVVLSTTAYPEGYDSWFAYVSDLDNIEGIASIPAFYAAYSYLGDTGVFLLALALLALVVTSLVANIVALSRLLRAVALDGVIPQKLSELNDQDAPEKAIIFVTLVSLVVPFVGRSAIGWIVDVTTIGAVIAYGFVSVATVKTAVKRNDGSERVTGIIGLAITIVLGLAILLPTAINTSVMAAESYLLFVVWSIIGFAYFRFYILTHDEQRRFGNYAIVWVTLTGFVLIMSVSWMGQIEQQETDAVIGEIRAYYVEGPGETGKQLDEEEFISQELDRMHQSNKIDTLIVIALLGFSLAIMLSNFTYVRKREEESQRRLGEVQSVAYTDSLTGVKSKHAYVDWEQQMDGRIGEREAGLEFAIIVLDVNGLKHINDTQGHKAGDAYVKAACELICNEFKHSPVFRVGGDEFVVVLEGADFLNRARLVREFRVKVEANLETGGAVVSEGVAEYKEGVDKRVQLVFERADALMYERKMQLKAMGANTRD